MKSHILLLICLLSWTMLVAQTDITPEVSQAFKKGDAAAIAAHLMPQVEMTIPRNDAIFQRPQALQMLSVFFKENPPQSFTVKHQGTSKLDDQFRIGELVTSNGVFRVTFFMKKINNTLQIKQLKIEPA